jgi:8-oxo-dGTP pyrophosphatase MutT (NUDIX family)
MLNILTGDRVGRQGKLMPGSSAAIFDESRAKLFLVRRSDNGKWSLPGGQMEPGESAEECAIRELREETDIAVRITRLIGIYTSPDYLIQYKSGDRVQPLTFSFEAEIISGIFHPTEETSDGEYFSREEIETLDLLKTTHERIADAFANQTSAFIR